jgi:hypothetical protein
MQWRWVASALVALALLSPVAQAAEKANLKVLYAGNVDSPRGKDFTSFLEQQVAKVTPVDLSKLRDADAQGHDVVIVDWTSIYPRDKDGKITRDNEKSLGLTMPPAMQLSHDYDRPTVLIGAAGGQFSQRQQLKTDWL